MRYVILFFLFPVMLSAQAIEVFNANTVADLIEKKSATYRSFKANFVYQKDRASFNGELIYMAPNNFLMQFKRGGAPQDKRIVVDGTYAWVQEGAIIARQRLEEETNPIDAWNLRRMRQQYIPIAPSSGLEIMYGSIPAYQINFEPKWNTTAFRSIDVISDREGLIRRIRAVSRVGTETVLTLSYKEYNQDYNPNIFVIETSEDSQIYDNIFE